MYKRILFPSFFICLVFWAFSSCDSEYNELGADMIGGDNFEVGEPEYFTVKAFNQDLGPVETSDLAVNALGIYKDSIFGETTATLAVQLQLETVNPTFDTALNQAIDSVVLYVPYFATRKALAITGASTYTLDSIYSKGNDPKIKLSVHESKFYMQNTDPVNTSEAFKYYSNQRSDFDNVKGARLNNSLDLSQNDAFFFSEKEIVDQTKDSENNTTKTYSSPGMRLFLDKDFFYSKIFQAPSGKLYNNTVFKEYFRGLYFSVEHSSASANTSLAMLNIKGGKITVYYHQKKEANKPETENKTLVLKLNGRSVNFLEKQPGTAVAPEQDMLYLKGGHGSMAVIDLFGRDADGDSQELDDLRDKKWLVNDASLTFTVHRASMEHVKEPNRIYLYDLTNKRPIADYYSDQTVSTKPKYAKTTYGGIIKKQNGRGYEYKIRLTNYIRTLLKHRDSTNVRLGLVVTENIAEVSNKKLKTEISTFGIKQIPASSVMSPLGTVIYGTEPPRVGEDDNRIKFKIYFTKPKQN